MTLDELAEALAEALYARDDASEFTTWEELPDWNRRMWLANAEALLPTVTAYAEQRARARAAEELRAAAEDVDDGEFSDRWSDAARRAILARAATLDGGQS